MLNSSLSSPFIRLLIQVLALTPFFSATSKETLEEIHVFKLISLNRWTEFGLSKSKVKLKQQKKHFKPKLKMEPIKYSLY